MSERAYYGGMIGDAIREYLSRMKIAESYPYGEARTQRRAQADAALAFAFEKFVLWVASEHERDEA